MLVPFYSSVHPPHVSLHTHNHIYSLKEFYKTYLSSPYDNGFVYEWSIYVNVCDFTIAYLLSPYT